MIRFGLGVLVGALLGSGALVVLHLWSAHAPPAPAAPGAPRAHSRTAFDLTVAAPSARVFPLFGAEGERAWSEGWSPRFLFPPVAADVPGAVFVVRHGEREIPWITTVFDSAAGHAQHVYVVPSHMAVRIDIHVTPRDAASTLVHVVYERTSLGPEADALVTRQGAADGHSAADWQRALDAWARAHP